MIVTQHSQEPVGAPDCLEIIWQLFVQCLVFPPIFFLIKNFKIALRTNCVPVLAKFLSELVSNIWNICYQILTLAWCKSLSKICALQDEFDQILVNKSYNITYDNWQCYKYVLENILRVVSGSLRSSFFEVSSTWAEIEMSEMLWLSLIVPIIQHDNWNVRGTEGGGSMLGGQIHSVYNWYN